MNKAKNLTSSKKWRFVLVGIFNTVLDFGLMNVFRLFVPLPIANIISTGIAMMSSFFLNKKWTFKSTGKNYVREVTLFFLFTIIGIWVIQTGFIWFIKEFVPHFGLPDVAFDNIAKIIASVPSLIWNYVTYNKIVFRDKQTARKETESQGL
ncbi:GtrA family protein [Candidatus Saccharibacteria bacterium]|nr:GtrA family protein [Candidatus Saccharibacteria bacterium]